MKGRVPSAVKFSGSNRICPATQKGRDCAAPRECVASQTCRREYRGGGTRRDSGWQSLCMYAGTMRQQFCGYGAVIAGIDKAKREYEKSARHTSWL